MFGMLEGVVDQRIAYSYSLYFSDKFSYTNYFNPRYGLKDINFISLIQFKIIYKSFSIFFYYLFNIIYINFNTDQWVPLVSD